MKSRVLSGEKVEFYELLKNALKSIVNTRLNGICARFITEDTVRTVEGVTHDCKSPSPIQETHLKHPKIAL